MRNNLPVTGLVHYYSSRNMPYRTVAMSWKKRVYKVWHRVAALARRSVRCGAIKQCSARRGATVTTVSWVDRSCAAWPSLHCNTFLSHKYQIQKQISVKYSALNLFHLHIIGLDDFPKCGCGGWWHPPLTPFHRNMSFLSGALPAPEITSLMEIQGWQHKHWYSWV